MSVRCVGLGLGPGPGARLGGRSETAEGNVGGLAREEEEEGTTGSGGRRWTREERKIPKQDRGEDGGRGRAGQGSERKGKEGKAKEGEGRGGEHIALTREAQMNIGARESDASYTDTFLWRCNDRSSSSSSSSRESRDSSCFFALFAHRRGGG